MEPLPTPPDQPQSLTGWQRDLGLRPGRAWLADPRFGLAQLAGVAFWLLLAWRGAIGPAYGLSALFSLVLLQPLLEELLFRGLLQGKLAALAWERLMHAVAYLKDNRLLPAGMSPATADPISGWWASAATPISSAAATG